MILIEIEIKNDNHGRLGHHTESAQEREQYQRDRTDTWSEPEYSAKSTARTDQYSITILRI